MNNTITIDHNIYRGAEMYAKLNNISIKEVVETSLKLLLGHINKPQTDTKSKWSNYQLSPKIKDMTLKHRKNVSDDIEVSLFKAMEEKYK